MFITCKVYIFLRLIKRSMKDIRLLKLNISKGGQATGAIMGIVVVGAMLAIGLLVNSKIFGAINQDTFTAAENTTLTNVRTNVNTGFDVGSIIPIVLVFAVVVALFAGFRGR